jgi:hypothetical protein
VSEVFDAANSECHVYVRRAGLLAAVGHDLELRVGAYRVELDRAGARVTARFDAASLRVVEAVEGRRRRPGRLSASDKAQIESNVVQKVLRAARHPSIEFQSTAIEALDGAYRVRGALTLLGRTRETEFTVVERGGELSAEVVVHQPDFAIEPFRAVGGALRVHPDVLVEFRARPRATTTREG